MQTIVYRITPEGVETAMSGFNGTACLKEAKAINSALQQLGVGVKLGSLVPTDELREELARLDVGAVEASA